jgi:hypothetical protein
MRYINIEKALCENETFICTLFFQRIKNFTPVAASIESVFYCGLPCIANVSRMNALVWPSSLKRTLAPGNRTGASATSKQALVAVLVHLFARTVFRLDRWPAFLGRRSCSAHSPELPLQTRGCPKCCVMGAVRPEKLAAPCLILTIIPNGSMGKGQTLSNFWAILQIT